MVRLGAQLSGSEISSILKNTFSVGIFWWSRPHTSFPSLIGYMVRSGAKLLRSKTLLNFASKALSYSFFQKTRFRFEFSYKIAPHRFSWPNGIDGMIGGKSVPERSFVDAKKHVFGWNFFMKPTPYLFSEANWLYMVHSGVKLFWMKTLLNFVTKALSNSFFRKNTFSVWIFVQNRTSPIFLAKRNRWHDWGQKCPGAKFRPS